LPEVDNPIDVDDDFAGCIEGLDAQDGEDEEENGDDNNCWFYLRFYKSFVLN